MKRSAFALALAMALTLLPACGGQSDASVSTPVDSSISAPVEGGVSVDSSEENGDISEEPETPEVPEETEPGVNQPIEFALDKTDFTLFAEGNTYQLKAIHSLEAAELVWASNNEEIAAVAEDGTVTAVAPGTAVITVTAGDLTASCTVRCKFEVKEETPAAPTTPAEENKPVEELPAAKSVVLAEFYAEMYEKLFPLDENGDPTGPFNEDFAAVPEMLEGYYPGLTAIETKQLHLYKPMMSGVPYELLLVEVANAADVEAVKTIIQTRIDAMVGNQREYPIIVDTWEFHSKLAVNGNYIMLAVCEMSGDYVDGFNAKF